jgi:hypothetical protein
MSCMDTPPIVGESFGSTWILQLDGIDVQPVALEGGKHPEFFLGRTSDRGSYRVCLDFGTHPPPKRCVRVAAEFRDPREVIADLLRVDGDT